jgi:hypothetical protein
MPNPGIEVMLEMIMNRAQDNKRILKISYRFNILIDDWSSVG